MQIACKTRESWLDEVKGFLIFMVVFGHMTADIQEKGTMMGFLHYLIYAIHMPMFIFISGYLSKNRTTIKKVFCDQIIPYIIFDLLYVSVSKFVGGGSSYSWNILYPSQALWYILCLSLMRVMVSYLPSRSLPWISLLCVFLSIGSTQLPESTWRFLSLGRVILLFPIFYVGYCITPDQMRKIRNGKKIEAGICLVVLIIIEGGLLDFHVVDGSATHNYTDVPIKVLAKYLYMAFTIIWFACFSVLLSGKSRILCRWGKNSLIIYLVHMYFVYVCNIVFRLPLNAVGLFIASFICSFAITDLLSMDVFKRLYDKIHLRIVAPLLNEND